MTSILFGCSGFILTVTRRYGMVWRKTLATYREWSSAEGWDERDTIEVPAVQKYTFKVSIQHLLC